MNRLIQTLWIACLPLAFLTAGAGMLWLYTTIDPSLDFYQRMLTYESAWVGSHMVLFASTILMVPAALLLWCAVRVRRGRVLAGLGLLMVIPAMFFLAGQYAIDFVMPLVAQAGEDAHQVHRGLFATSHINVMFYGFPELGFLGLLLMTLALAVAGRLSGLIAVLLALLWVGVIAGNILGYVLAARICLLLLGVAYLPLAWQFARESGREPRL